MLYACWCLCVRFILSGCRLVDHPRSVLGMAEFWFPGQSTQAPHVLTMDDSAEFRVWSLVPIRPKVCPARNRVCIR